MLALSIFFYNYSVFSSMLVHSITHNGLNISIMTFNTAEKLNCGKVSHSKDLPSLVGRQMVRVLLDVGDKNLTRN